MGYLNSSYLLYGCNGEVKNTIPRIESIVLSCIIICMIIIAVFGNTLVCVAVYKFPNLRTLTNALLCSLAVADLLTPLVRLLHMVIALLKGHMILGCEWCQLSSNLGVFLCSASIIHLCAVSLERYLIINHPLKYNLWVTKRRIILLLICIWLLSMLMSILPYLKVVKLTFEKDLLDCTLYLLHSPELALLLALVYFALPFLVMILVYHQIYKTVQRQTQSMSVYSLGNKVEKRKRKIQKEWKAVKTVIVIIGFFFSLWLPYFCITAIHAYDPLLVAGWIKRLAFYLAYSNSCVNWIVYSVMNKQLRYAFMTLLHLTRGPNTDKITTIASTDKNMLTRSNNSNINAKSVSLWNCFKRCKKVRKFDIPTIIIETKGVEYGKSILKTTSRTELNVVNDSLKNNGNFLSVDENNRNPRVLKKRVSFQDENKVNQTYCRETALLLKRNSKDVTEYGHEQRNVVGGY